MKLSTYIFKAHHDKGVSKIKVVASSAETALMMLCKAENAPASAFELVKVQ